MGESGIFRLSQSIISERHFHKDSVATLGICPGGVPEQVEKATIQGCLNCEKVAFVQSVAPNTPKVITTREEAENLARRGVRVASLLAGAQAARATAMVAAEAVNKTRIERLAAEKTQICQALGNWAKNNRAEFAGKQSLELKGALLKFNAGRRSVELIDPENSTYEKVVAAMVRGFRVLAAWRKWVKVSFDLDKQAILRDTQGEQPVLSADKLKDVGLKISQNESFAIEFQVSAKPAQANPKT